MKKISLFNILIFTGILCFCGLAGSAVIIIQDQSSDLNEALIAYYPFNDNVRDESGNGLNGITSGAALISDRNGNSNSALQFDGRDDYVDCGDDSIFKMQDGGTIAAWIYPYGKGGDGNGYGRIIDKSNDYDGIGGYSLFMSGEIERVHFEMDNIRLKSTDGSTPYNHWTHVAVTFDGSHRKIFINGVLNASDNETILPANVVTNLYIGNRAGDPDRGFDGIIDEVRLYGYALSETDIQALYSSTEIQVDHSTKKDPPSEVVILTPQTEAEIANCPVVFGNMRANLNFPAYSSPVDIYIAIMNSSGMLLFLNSDAQLTTAFSAYAIGTTSMFNAEHAVTDSSLASALTGQCFIFWLIAPSNGGDLISSLNDNIYEIGSYETDGSIDIFSPKIVQLIPTETDAISVAWLANSSSKIFEVHVGTSDGFTPSSATLKKEVSGEFQADISGLNAGTTYYVLVVARNQNDDAFAAEDYWRVTTNSTPMEFSSDVALISAQAAGLGIAEISGDTYLFQKNGTEQLPESGSIIVGEDDEIGYLRKVDTVSVTGDEIFLETSYATLSEAITAGRISNTVRLFAPSSENSRRSLTSTAKGYKIDRSVKSDGSAFTRMEWKNKLLAVEEKISPDFVPSTNRKGFRKVDLLKATSEQEYQYYFRDSDKDGYGDAKNWKLSLSKPSGYISDNTDCDDTEAEIHPGAMEIPENGIDENCDGSDGDDVLLPDVNNQITLEASLEFQPSMRTDIGWHTEWLQPVIDSGEVIAIGTFRAQMSARYKFDAAYKWGTSDKPNEKELWERTWTSVYLAGGVPVFQEIILTLKAQSWANASAEIDTTATAFAETEIEMGVRYNPGTQKWEPVTATGFGSGLTATLHAEGVVEGEVRLVPNLEVKFYKVAGVNMSLEPYSHGLISYGLDSSLSGPTISQFSHFDFYMGMDCKMSLTLQPIFDNDNPLYSGTLYDYIWPIFELPQFSITSTHSGESYFFNAGIKDGANNEFERNSIEWEVYDPDGDRTPLGNGAYDGFTTAEFTPNSDGTYFILMSGYGQLGSWFGEIARRYTTIELEVDTSKYYPDDDGDGYGDPAFPINAASQPSGYVTDNTDCDDTDPTIHPGAVEIPGDGIDQDCDDIDPAGSQGDTFTNSLGMIFVRIEPGTFMMGSPEDEWGRGSDEPLHEVTLTQGYYMQTTEVTQGQWEALMGSNPSYFSNCGDDCPVEQVSRYDAHQFIEALNDMEEGTYALPTEAQWEYAARAGTTTAFANGDIDETASYYTPDPNLDVIGWYSGNSEANYSGCYSSSPPIRRCTGTQPVAQKDANAWGLYDMHGNVYEWCKDGYTTKYGSENGTDSVTDPIGNPSSSGQVAKGGAWNTSNATCRSANRYSPKSYITDSENIGFRLKWLP